MRKYFYAAIAVAGILAQAGPSSAVAATLTYDLSGSATFASGTDNVSGSFTYNTATGTLGSVNITVTGPVLSGTYTTPLWSNGTSITAGNLSAGNLSTGGLLRVSFASSLGGASASLSRVGNFFVSSTSVTGSAVDPPNGAPLPSATPLPPTVTLFGTALALFGFILYARQRGSRRAAPA